MSETLAVSYVRTSSATNVDGNSMVRQSLAIEHYAERVGTTVVATFIDAAVKGADAVSERRGFSALLTWCEESGCDTIIVENASRFARDLIVQEVGYAMLRDRGIQLIAADDPDAFTSDTPTAIMVRQILGAVAQFEKAGIVAKLKGARERASAALGDKCAGRGRSYVAGKPELVAMAKRLAADGRSLRVIASELAQHGHVTATGRAFGPEQVKLLIAA